MIWFEDEKLEARPPPLDSWINTIPHINIDARMTRTMISEYIVVSYIFVVFKFVLICAACLGKCHFPLLFLHL